MKKAIMIILLVSSIFSENLRVAIIHRHDNGGKKLLVKYLGQGANETVVERITYAENGDTLILENTIENIIMKREYYPSGYLMSEKYFRNEKPFDKYYYYYPNGQIEEEGEFINGTSYTINYWKDDGNLLVEEGNGRLFTYLGNGQIYLEVNVKDGKFVGRKTYSFQN